MSPLMPIYVYTIYVNILFGMCLYAHPPARTPITRPARAYMYVAPTVGVTYPFHARVASIMMLVITA